MAYDLSGKVCLVTGASRGVGKGIAAQLALHGAKCYVTGRRIETLQELAKEVSSAGSQGTCIPIVCDHQNDAEVQAVFDRIESETNAKLDLVVNNAYSAIKPLMKNMTKFWEQPEDMWDVINNVGLRNHYKCATLAARIMVKRKRGLIINVSSVGGIRYLFSAPYGIGKAAMCRMARDCAIELQDYGVSFVSLLPGLVKTEYMVDLIKESSFEDKLGPYAATAETPTYVGRTVAALLSESQDDLMKRSGKSLLTTDIGRQYGLTDEAGLTPTAMFQLNAILYSEGYRTLSGYVPNFLRVPQSLVKFAESMKTS